MTKKAHTIPKSKVAYWFTYPFHPFVLSFWVVILIQYSYLLEGPFILSFIGLVSFIGPVLMYAFSKNFNNRWNKKPLFKRLADEEPAIYFRLVPAMAIFAATLTLQIFSFALPGPFGSFHTNLLTATFAIALFCRWFFNISLHQISVGLLAGIVYVKLAQDEYHLIAMGLLTLGLILGRVQYYLEQHKILESLAGFALGAVIGYISMSDPSLLHWHGYF